MTKQCILTISVPFFDQKITENSVTSFKWYKLNSYYSFYRSNRLFDLGQSFGTSLRKAKINVNWRSQKIGQSHIRDIRHKHKTTRKMTNNASPSRIERHSNLNFPKLKIQIYGCEFRIDEKLFYCSEFLCSNTLWLWWCDFFPWL